MAVPYWIASPEWTTCILAGNPLPGIVEVEVTRDTKIDVQNPKGADGAYTQDEGMEPAKIAISVVLANELHLRDWELTYPLIYPKTHGKKRSPLEIGHPECDIMGVKAVYIQSIKGMPPTARRGKRYSISCVEYLAKPKKPKKRAAKGTPYTPGRVRKARSVGGFQNLTAFEQAYQPTGADALDRAFADPFNNDPFVF